MVEEVRDKTGVALENDDVYMNTTFEAFMNTVVIKSRGGEEVELEYDAVSCVRGVSCVWGVGGEEVELEYDAVSCVGGEEVELEYNAVSCVGV